MFWLGIAKTYDKINSIFRDVFKINLRGVGYLLRKLKRPFFDVPLLKDVFSP
jgi:hypothetical protein